MNLHQKQRNILLFKTKSVREITGTGSSSWREENTGSVFVRILRRTGKTYCRTYTQPLRWQSGGGGKSWREETLPKNSYKFMVAVEILSDQQLLE